MVAYDHELIIDRFASEKKGVSKKKPLFITESKTFSADDYPFKEKFHNNQNRILRLYSDNDIRYAVKDQRWVFTIEDVVSFSWLQESNEIFYQLLPSATEELLRYWLLHIVLPLYLTTENLYYFLHAGAVQVDKKSVLFMADSFGGKSTLTDFFLKKGHTLISDDKVATFEENDTFMAVPSYSYHRPYRATEDLGIKVDNFATEPRPIKAIYLLISVDEDVETTISPAKGIEKFSSLRFATEVGLPLFMQERFAYLTKLANNTAIFNVTIPWDLDRLSEVYDAIVAHTKTL
ncbi:MAG: hypothetical protein U9Q62_06010 [Campylobacterota bacterium]|nr:hypothetical protein [Campylobacterota bacterium]